MQNSLQITYDEHEPADRCAVDFIDDTIELHYDKYIKCKIQLEPHNPSEQQLNNQNEKQKLKIVLDVGSKRLVVRCLSDCTKEDFRQSIETLLKDVQPQLDKHNEIKNLQQYGNVSSLTKSLNFGTITTTENEVVYFHADSLINFSFEQVTLGHKVKFLLSKGPLGTQAHHIYSLAIS